MMIAASCLIIVLAVVCTVKITAAYETVDVSSIISVNYSGYNTKGSAELTLDQAALKKITDESYSDYIASIFPFKAKCTQEEYDQLAASFIGNLDKTEDLSNGDDINISFQYDKDLAKKLKVNVIYDDINLNVEGLSDATSIEQEQLFQDVSVSVNGVSPVLSVSVNNLSTDDFLKTITYQIKDSKEYYENGDSIVIQANYNEEDAINNHLKIAEDASQKQISLDGYDSYVTSVSQIPDSIFNHAVELGKTYFTDANTYGLRIFSEANLMPIWINKKTTFEWSNPYLISAYLQTVKEEQRGTLGKPFNYLELVYEVTISQSDGVGCQAEAVVCFSDVKLDENGNCILDEETGQLFSASHNDKSIKESISGWFETDYNLEKFTIE